MRITKGVITAAGAAQRRLPVQTLVDTDGVTRTVLAMLVNEIVSAGVEEICVVVAPGDEAEYARAVPDHAARIRFVPQAGAPGYAQALLCAQSFTKDDPFLHLVSDHVYVNANGSSCASTLVQIASEANCSVSAVQATHESLISRFGVVMGQATGDRGSVYAVERVAEKPTPTEAEENLVVSGLRSAYYLAFFGMHVFTPTLLDIISQKGGSVSAALNSLLSHERYLAVRVTGDRYDLGPRYGLLTAQLALTFAGKDREEVLTSLVGLLASRSLRGGSGE
jgi:UTP--glucose-1-phosphate uridylyltransferase